jgi:hypothetical protein
MNKEKVIILARELFKIRISSSREGAAQDDGVHKLEVEGITSYNLTVIEKWYMEAIKTAEIIIGLEEEYLNRKDGEILDNPN